MIKDIFASLILPFRPQLTFNRISASGGKSTLMIIASILITVSASFLLAYSNYRFEDYHWDYLLPFVIGVILRILLTSVILAIVVSKALDKEIDLAQSLAIVSVCMPLSSINYLHTVLGYDYMNGLNILSQIFFWLYIFLGIKYQYQSDTTIIRIIRIVILSFFITKCTILFLSPNMII